MDGSGAHVIVLQSQVDALVVASEGVGRVRFAAVWKAKLNFDLRK